MLWGHRERQNHREYAELLVLTPDRMQPGERMGKYTVPTQES